MKIIARIRNDFKEKFGIPRQSGIADSFLSTIVFEQEYRVKEALRGIEGYSHLWLIWNFPNLREIPSRRPCALPGLAGTREWECLPRDLLSAQIR